MTTGPSSERRCARDVVVTNIMRASDAETSRFMIENPANLTSGAELQRELIRFTFALHVRAVGSPAWLACTPAALAE